MSNSCGTIVRITIYFITSMSKIKIVTKEKVKLYYKGKEDRKTSMQDDLETIYHYIFMKLAEYQSTSIVRSFLLLKLSDSEMKLLQSNDEKFVWSFYNNSFGPILEPHPTEQPSESKSRYALSFCNRITSIVNAISTEIFSESDFKASE